VHGQQILHQRQGLVVRDAPGLPTAVRARPRSALAKPAPRPQCPTELHAQRRIHPTDRPSSVGRPDR
jgi:hypothetical protein